MGPRAGAACETPEASDGVAPAEGTAADAGGGTAAVASAAADPGVGDGAAVGAAADAGAGDGAAGTSASTAVASSAAASALGPCLGKVPSINRECGWKAAQRTCNPGARISIGCCGGGTSAGDPMMRVCAGDAPCPHPGLANSDDDSNDCMDDGVRVRTTCPQSGRITVMTGSAFSDEASTCKYVIK